MWADLLILARWSNPTFDREQVLCILCNGVWCQPATTYCGHTFCRSCLLKGHTNCPKCGEEIRGILPSIEAAENLLSNYWAERHVSDEKLQAYCVRANISCALYSASHDNESSDEQQEHGSKPMSEFVNSR